MAPIRDFQEKNTNKRHEMNDRKKLPKKRQIFLKETFKSPP